MRAEGTQKRLARLFHTRELLRGSYRWAETRRRTRSASLQGCSRRCCFPPRLSAWAERSHVARHLRRLQVVRALTRCKCVERFLAEKMRRAALLLRPPARRSSHHRHRRPPRAYSSRKGSAGRALRPLHPSRFPLLLRQPRPLYEARRPSYLLVRCSSRRQQTASAPPRRRGHPPRQLGRTSGSHFAKSLLRACAGSVGPALKSARMND